MTRTKPTKGKVIVSGILFWYPLAGVTFQFLHYLIGLRRLGYDPFYLEDSGRWIYDPRLNDLSPDVTGNVEAVLLAPKQHPPASRWCWTCGTIRTRLRRRGPTTPSPPGTTAAKTSSGATTRGIGRRTASLKNFSDCRACAPG